MFSLTMVWRCLDLLMKYFYVLYQNLVMFLNNKNKIYSEIKIYN